MKQYAKILVGFVAAFATLFGMYWLGRWDAFANFHIGTAPLHADVYTDSANDLSKPVHIQHEEPYPAWSLHPPELVYRFTLSEVQRILADYVLKTEYLVVATNYPIRILTWHGHVDDAHNGEVDFVWNSKAVEYPNKKLFELRIMRNEE